jgi:hypothetical protein
MTSRYVGLVFLIGVVGYAGAFPVVAVLLTMLFWHSKPAVTV